MTSKISIKKGGRPVKSLAEKRKYRLSLKLNTNEYLQLKSKARVVGKNRCDFLREFVLTGKVRQRFIPELNEVVKQIGGMSNNLNQLVRKAHIHGVWHIEISGQRLIAEIHELIKHFKP